MSKLSKKMKALVPYKDSIENLNEISCILNLIIFRRKVEQLMRFKTKSSF